MTAIKKWKTEVAKQQWKAIMYSKMAMKEGGS